jgi:hypothetical protein
MFLSIAGVIDSVLDMKMLFVTGMNQTGITAPELRKGYNIFLIRSRTTAGSAVPEAVRDDPGCGNDFGERADGLFQQWITLPFGSRPDNGRGERELARGVNQLDKESLYR